MAGKVLVLDIDVDGGVVVKTSFAVGNNIANGTPAAPDLDAFLAREIARWFDAAKRASLAAVYSPEAEDPSMEAAHHGLDVQDHLCYLMMLDALAVAEGERGIRWFTEPFSAAKHFISAQKSTEPKSLPLDKILTQHALPLLYLNTPSLSFLVWLSPLTYLRLLRTSPVGELRTGTGSTDIPSAHLMSSLSKQSDGATIASLKLITSPETFGVSSPPDFQTTTPFPISLHILGSSNSTDPPVTSAGTGLGSMGSFGSVGPVPGINMGQLGFNGFMMGPPRIQSIGPNGSGGSWVDLLLNNGLPTEYYTSTYKSPSGAHAPLNLRLTTPQEPGFVLRKVPVKSASQVLRILEIVREQCWLNELLGMLQWQPNGIAPPPKGQTVSSGPLATISDQQVEGPVSAELLASVLAGTVNPRSIPVSVYLPSTILPPLAQTNPSGSHFGLEGSASAPLRSLVVLVLAVFSDLLTWTWTWRSRG
ncbi:hypothetical protein BU15DRAFT_84151 [Melanogaster broomeanus]|nr:hypothetical protein BU15DRAFT_84151 [Melanogaster broomeanus]